MSINWWHHLLSNIIVVVNLWYSNFSWCQTPVATESLKICFKVIDLLLQNKSSEVKYNLC